MPRALLFEKACSSRAMRASALSFLCCLVACSAHTRPETEGGLDGNGIDAAMSDAVVVADSASDANADAASDEDAAMDAAADGAADSGGDAATDAGGDAAGDGGPHEGDPVGSPCTSADECASLTTPACLSHVHPLSTLVGVPAELAMLGPSFANGYCSTEPNCVNDAACGVGGGCFRPFEHVTAQTLRDLEPYLLVATGSLDFFPTYGVCLRACTTASQCATGQICDIVLESFTALVPGAVNETKFCIPDPECPNGVCPPDPCSPNPCQHGGFCLPTATTFQCACAPGYGGPLCEVAAPVRDRQVGQSCTVDAQCDLPLRAQCITELHPLMAFPFPNEVVDAYGIEFGRGYCSSVPNCASNVECGAHGRCFAPFRNVLPSTFRELEMQASLPSGALDSMGAYGVCLRECASPLDCFPDQSCGLVFTDLTSFVTGSENTQTYCAPHPDCRYCAAHAHCFVDANQAGTCTCDAGYSGNGLTCTPSPG